MLQMKPLAHKRGRSSAGLRLLAYRSTTQGGQLTGKYWYYYLNKKTMEAATHALSEAAGMGGKRDRPAQTRF